MIVSNPPNGVDNCLFIFSDFFFTLSICLSLCVLASSTITRFNPTKTKNSLCHSLSLSPPLFL